MKWKIITLSLVSFTPLAKAQISTQRYSIGAFIGLTKNMAASGPKAQTAVSEVKVQRSEAKTMGLNFDFKSNPDWFVGAEFSYDEFEGGYYAVPHTEHYGLGIESGLLTTDERLAIYKAGLRLGKPVKIFNRFFVNFILTPYAAYSRYIVEDTARENDAWQIDTRRSTAYVRYPRYQKTGLHFVVKASAELQYKFRNNMSVALDCAYQQGFRPFVVDTVNIIRRYEPNAPEHKYWTRYSGTSLQFHIGLKYDFL